MRRGESYAVVVVGWCAVGSRAAVVGSRRPTGYGRRQARRFAAGLLDLSAATLLRVELGLLIGTPGLAALGVATGALVAGLRGAGAVAGLVMLPLAVPLLIFGAGAIEQGSGAFKLLGAVSLVLVAGAPFVAAAAIRVGLD